MSEFELYEAVHKLADEIKRSAPKSTYIEYVELLASDLGVLDETNLVPNWWEDQAEIDIDRAEESPASTLRYLTTQMQEAIDKLEAYQVEAKNLVDLASKAIEKVN